MTERLKLGAIDLRFYTLVFMLVVFASLGGCSKNKPEIVEAGDTENTVLSDDPLLADLESEYAEDNGENSDESISDPFEQGNRVIFIINDKLYFWLIKPISRVYGWILFPRFIRQAISNFFDNLEFPRRSINCLLQGQLLNCGREFARFFINATIGVGGLWDPATKLGLEKQEEDFDQTLGVWRIGMGWYVTWLFYGPSSVRGTVGLVIDTALNPATYFVPGLGVLVVINETSLGDNPYEKLLEISLEPYIAVREAYVANRREMIRDRGQRDDAPEEPADDDDVWIDRDVLKEYETNGIDSR